MKRKASPPATDDGSDYEAATPDTATPPASKRRNLSGSDKVAKKVARMERNRQAAQISRDRKKNYVAELEATVANLESRLGAEAPAALDSPRLSNLEAENASLKVQLAEEASQRQTLQTRLDDLESQMSALNTFLQSRSASSTPFEAVSPLALTASDVSLQQPLLAPHSLVAAELGGQQPAAAPSSPPFDLQADFQHTWEAAQWVNALFQEPGPPAVDFSAFLSPDLGQAHQDPFLSEGLFV